MNLFVYLVCFSVLFESYLATEMLVFAPFDTPQVTCPENEMFHYCLNNCTNCQQLGFCTVFECKERGCDCVPYFVRITPGAPCEPLAKCPIPQCGENEVFRECGPVCETCSTLNCRVIQCEHKCFCKQGYKRDFEGKCVPEEECPAKLHCSRHEEMADEGPENEYCVHAEGEIVSNSTQNKTQCYCQTGFKRGLTGHCRDEKYCGTAICMENEIYNLCPRKCNSTCRNYDDNECVEDGNCYPGCFCKEGYYMNDHRRCVKLEECPPGSNPYAATAPPKVETTIPSSISSKGSSLSEDFTTPGTFTTKENNKSTPEGKSKSTVAEDEDIQDSEGDSMASESPSDSMDEDELPEDLPDEDVPLDDEDDETTQAVVSTTFAPVIKPLKRTRYKSQANSQANSQTTSHKTSQASSQAVGQKQSISSKSAAAMFDDLDMDENE